MNRYGKQDEKEANDWQGSFRMRAKRQTAQKRDNYDLHTAKQMISPLGGVAKIVS